MIQQVLSHYHLPLLACTGLLLFMAVFSGALLWVYRGGSRAIYEKHASIPLNEDGFIGESQL